MEELQSTEVLDREILEDARKKAYRILKTADDTVKAKAGEWEQKAAGAGAELGKKYTEQGNLVSGEIMTRLPMDKRRAKAEKIESLLRQAVENWYSGLSRARVLALLEAELARRLAYCAEFSAAGGPIRAAIHKIERGEAEAVLKAALPEQMAAGCVTIEEPAAALPYPEIVLENSTARISASINKTVDYLLHEKRAELAAALLGDTALESDTGLAAAGEAS